MKTISKFKEMQRLIGESMKSGDIHKKNTLRTVVGEAQTIASRSGSGDPDDKTILSILKKSRVNALESLEILKDPENTKNISDIELLSRKANLTKDVELYDWLLPNTFDQATIENILKGDFIIKNIKEDINVITNLIFTSTLISPMRSM